MCAGLSNDDRADDNGNVGKCVTKIVNEDAAEIEVAPPAYQRQGDSAIHRQGRRRSPDHPRFHNRDG